MQNSTVGTDLSKRIAYHAAGHGVMSIWLKLKFESISISNDGAMRMREDRFAERNADIVLGKLNIREALSSVSGIIAEYLFFEEVDENVVERCQKDAALIYEACDMLPKLGVSFTNLVCPSFLAKSMSDALVSFAAKILKKKRSEVEKLAKALHRERSMSYEAVKKLIASD